MAWFCGVGSSNCYISFLDIDLFLPDLSLDFFTRGKHQKKERIKRKETKSPPNVKYGRQNAAKKKLRNKISRISIPKFSLRIFKYFFYFGKFCDIYFWTSRAATEACHSLLESVKKSLILISYSTPL